MKNTILAIDNTFSLILKPDVQELILSALEEDRIEELVLFMLQMDKRRSVDSKKKRDYLNGLPHWLQKHVVWPMGVERYNDALFLRRAIYAYDVDEIWGGSLDVVSMYNKIKAEFPKEYGRIGVRTIQTEADVDSELKYYQQSRRNEPVDAALEKVV